MRMKPEHASRLNELMLLKHLSPRSALILTRRVARLINTERELARAFFKDEEKKAKAGLPFTKRQLAAIRKHRKEALLEYSADLCRLGSWIYQNDELLTARYGFDGVCDALEVNPIHRGQVMAAAEDRRRAITAVAFISGFEDSAGQQSGRHPTDWKDGPLFQTFTAMRQRSMADGLEGITDSLTSNGLQYPTHFPLWEAVNGRQHELAGGTQ